MKASERKEIVAHAQKDFGGALLNDHHDLAAHAERILHHVQPSHLGSQLLLCCCCVISCPLWECCSSEARPGSVLTDVVGLLPPRTPSSSPAIRGQPGLRAARASPADRTAGGGSRGAPRSRGSRTSRQPPVPARETRRCTARRSPRRSRRGGRRTPGRTVATSEVLEHDRSAVADEQTMRLRQRGSAGAGGGKFLRTDAAGFRLW